MNEKLIATDQFYGSHEKNYFLQKQAVLNLQVHHMFIECSPGKLQKAHMSDVLFPFLD